jgi:hypothetical protein
VGRDWRASDLVAGVFAGTDGVFGTDDDTLIAHDNPIVARIASILIKGTATGTANDSDHFGFVAEQIAGFESDGVRATLLPGPRNDLTGAVVGSTGDPARPRTPVAGIQANLGPGS